MLADAVKSGDKAKTACRIWEPNGCGAATGFPRKAAVTAGLRRRAACWRAPVSARRAPMRSRAAPISPPPPAAAHAIPTPSTAASPLPGGRAFETAFGTIFSPNITPDRETGIGRWRRSDLTAALRWGIAPDDSHFLTSFPFPFYNRLSQRDLADLKAFLDTVAPVRQANRANRRTPFAARSECCRRLRRWSFPDLGNPIRTRDPAWNRGAYLVATVGRCGDCHTPRNWLGAPDRNRFLAGAPAGPRQQRRAEHHAGPEDRDRRSWSERRYRHLAEDRAERPTLILSAARWRRSSTNTAKLTDDDRHAIAVYLKSLPPLPSDSQHPREKG